MKKILGYSEVVLGNLLTALAFGLLILPQRFAAGGVTGLGVVLHLFVPIRLSLIIYSINAILFILGWVFVSREFILKTAISSLVFPAFLDFFERSSLLGELGKDPLLSALIAGLLLGIGSGLILRGDGSSGGFDVIGVILHDHFNVPIAVVTSIMDTSVIILQYSDLLKTVYGILVILVSAFIVNRVLSFGSAKSKITIFSSHFEEIRDSLINDEDVGMTFLNGESGYLKKTMKVIVVVTPYAKIGAIKKAIYNIDPEAFVVIEDVHSVLGQGYTLPVHTPAQ